jgi:AraC family transcriptional regulator
MADLGLAADQPADSHGGPGADAARRLFLLLEGEPDELSVESLAGEILASLCRPPEPGPRAPRWLDDLPDRLDQALGSPHPLRHLAAAAGVHPVHFAAMFRRRFGCSLGDYARRRRVERARQLLADPDRCLAEVAAATGFSDQSHLTRSFKLATGMTPGRYRTLLAFKTGPATDR